MLLLLLMLLQLLLLLLLLLLLRLLLRRSPALPQQRRQQLPQLVSVVRDVAAQVEGFGSTKFETGFSGGFHSI